MAILQSLNCADLILDKGVGTRSAVTTTDDIVKIGGGVDFESSGNAKLYQMAVSYHRAKNRVLVVFSDDTQAGAGGSPPHAFGIVGKPSADGESIEWGPNHWDGNRGWLFEGPYGGQALSYDRYKECFCWAGTQGSAAGSSGNVNGIYSSTIQLSSGWNSENRNPSRGSAVTWNVGTSQTQSIGPQAMIYVGDDAGSSAGKHVLLYAHSANNLRAVVGTVSGSYDSFSVDWNTPLTNYATISTSGTNYEAHGCKVADNKIVAFWTNGGEEGWCRVGTVASGEITFGTAVRVDGGNSDSGLGPGSESICYDIASGKVVIAWWEWNGNGSDKLMARTGTVTGTNIALGTAYEIIPYAYNVHGKVSLVYDEGAQRTVIYYKRFAENDGSNDIFKLFARAATITGTDIAFGTEKLVEAPAGGKSFNRGSSEHYSYGLCSTYMSHADVKKTVVIRPGDGGSAFTGGGYAKATLTNLNVSTLTVDLSNGNAFVLDMDDIILHQGTIGTFTITESLTGVQVQTFTLKVIQGSPARDFKWSTITNVKWSGSTPPVAMSTTNNAVDIYSFTTYDAGTTWHGTVVGQNFT